MKKPKLILALCLSASIGFAQFNNVINVAGNGIYGTTTNGNAISKNLGAPEGVAVDNSGNMYIADKANGVILKVNANGVISTIAGTSGANGYSGDGGPASAALFNSPTYLCLDPSNNLYISDVNNFVVRKITAQNGVINSNCTITTVAGNGTDCYSHGVGTPVCGDAVIATGASFVPAGIAVDNNYNLFIATTTTIKEVFNTTTVINNQTYQAGYIYIIAGTEGSANFSGNNGPAINALFNSPHGIALDANSANLYICDSDNGQVRKINLSTRIITAFAGVGNALGGFSGDGGPAVSAKLSTNQLGIAVDANNNVYIADNGNFRIRMVNAAGTISTIAGTGSVPPVSCNYLAPAGNNNSSTGANINPYGVAVDACGSVYFGDYGYSVVGKIANGTVPVYNPTISSTSPICASAGSIVATGNSGSTIAPDSYSWQLLSCDASGHADGIYSSGWLVGGSTYTFPYIASTMPCGHNYLIEMTVRKNCPKLSVATAYTQVYINCNPTASITGNTSVCASAGAPYNTTTLYGNPTGTGYSYAWGVSGVHGIYSTNPNITVSPTSNTTYYLTVTNAVGCANLTSAVVTAENLQPLFTTTYDDGVGGLSAPFYTIEVSNQTFNSTDPSFGYYWDIQEVTGSAPSYVTVPGTEVKNPSCGNFWTGSSPSWFCGYQATNPPQYTSSTNPTLPACSTAFGGGLAGQGYFLKGHVYMITYGTWSNTCPWSSNYSIAYKCSTCRDGDESFSISNMKSDLTFEEAMGIKNNIPISDMANNLTIYPNPSNGNFIIETPSTITYLVEVYDLTGRLLLSQNISGSSNINASALPNGMYNIKISGTNKVINEKIIISK